MTPNTLTALRDVVPVRPLTVIEAMHVAELQAAKLLLASGTADPPLPESAVAALPRVQVERIFPAPSAGASQWSRGRWLIVVNSADPLTRQRFSLLHEFKHVIDHPFVEVLYPAAGHLTSRQRRETICDYFAACALMPRVWVKRVWASGVQDLATLGQLFAVSRQAMQVRLVQLGLTPPAPRCDQMGALS